MAQTKTKEIRGPMSFSYGSAPIVVTPINESFVSFAVETKEGTRERSDGREANSTTGFKLTVEMTFDEVDEDDISAIVAKAGQALVITQLDKTVNDIITLTPEFMSGSVANMQTTIKAIVTVDAGGNIGNLWTTTTTDAE